jgi:hypothetical protein
MYLLVRYDTGTSDNNITCEMSTLIAERLNYYIIVNARTSSRPDADYSRVAEVV